MIVVIQRVANAMVKVEDKMVSSISNGMLILLGISNSDSKENITKMTNKISKLRIFNDDSNIMNRDINQVFGEILVVSQFTLYGDTKKGNRPSYINAAKPDIAEPLYNMFVLELDKLINNKVKTGVFGANMSVDIMNDGPVTLIIEN
ncbi:MAG: D-tyrosyl-tRNA(Tyr) deacylase [Flavobacteriaceae bacterium]|jgi:D-aminoacyl-tRNA deacylase|nr:D-tyrosyl-tRNA(Tyr) deacylase [Flavobacteriaceae bacterium]MBT4113053.1 D-tyrosyl-tRNA(Tyr) deacylase [Flavobacteriaceae bacterium]MBT4613956.1 D-tyrosyl-tRNA(Tyr) deacylase [Flavobacteriaceae bacterium]MBT5246082.1 D-tyrosyl-tRNA(Tyr) deacylase [Flavobacteriaceae bacterium]MBT5650651.1 D-tyrosyl-tRNA(Tyr) deacylase [Flavobacteriaceae bacterium]|tara:strand:+ start:362 stop:802 length:441 start_codon:yes stop_codon:yes gene_type:complete